MRASPAWFRVGLRDRDGAPSRGGWVGRLGPLGAGGLEQPTDFRDVHIGQIPDIGNELAVGDEPEVEPVEVAHRGGVETLPVSNQRHRELVTNLRAIEIHRLRVAAVSWKEQT